MDVEIIEVVSNDSNASRQDDNNSISSNRSQPSLFFDLPPLFHAAFQRRNRRGIVVNHNNDNVADLISSQSSFGCGYNNDLSSLDSASTSLSTSALLRSIALNPPDQGTNGLTQRHQQRQALNNFEEGDDDILSVSSVVSYAGYNISAEQRATRDFLLRYAMEPAQDINVIGEIVDVKGDGNCFVYAITMGLFHLRIQPYHRETDTQQESMKHLKQMLKAVCETRQELYTFLQQHIMQFNSEDPHVRRLHVATGAQFREFRGSDDYIMRVVGQRLYTQGYNYSNGCSHGHWIDVNHHIPIVAMRHGCTVACYHLLGHQRYTTIAHYDNGAVYMYFLEGNYYTPPRGCRTICINYVNGCHFQYIRSHDYNGIKFQWADLDFDSDNVDDDSQDVYRSDDSNRLECNIESADDVNSFRFGLESPQYPGKKRLKLDLQVQNSSDADSHMKMLQLDNSVVESLRDDNSLSSGDEDRSDTLQDQGNNRLKLNLNNLVDNQNQIRSHADSLANPCCKVETQREDTSFCSGNESLNFLKPSPKILAQVSEVVGRKANISTYKSYDHRSTQNGKSFIHYKEFKKNDVLKVLVPSKDIACFFTFQHDGTELQKVEFHPSFVNRFHWFRNTVERHPEFPKHVAMIVTNSNTMTIRTGDGNKYGKRSMHPYIVKFNGTCAGSYHRNRKHVGNKCSTQWLGGIDYNNMKKLALFPFNSVIEICIQFNGCCIHEEGKSLGQLRGLDRCAAVDEVRTSKKSPKEFSLNSLMNADKTKFVTKNRTSTVSSPQQVWNLRREGRLKNAKEKGIEIGKSDVANIMNVIEATKKKDLESRKDLGDNSTDLLGIARTVCLQPMDIVLHSRTSLYLAGQLSDHGMLVIAIDATGNLVNFRNTRADGKTQHSFLNIQCKECILSNDAATNYGRDLYPPITVSERISCENTSQDFARWLSQVKNDTLTAMSFIQGKKATGRALRPVAIKMDCALQIMDGCIQAFRSADCKQVSYSTTYCNCVILCILRYEGKQQVDDNNDKKALAAQCYETLMMVSPSIMKQCKAHVAKAVAQYARRRASELPNEMKRWSKTFEVLFARVAQEMTSIGSLSECIARMSVVITMLLTKEIPCGKYNSRSVISSGHPRMCSRSIAVTMDRVIKEQAEAIQITNDEDFEKKMRQQFIDESSNTYDGHVIAQRVIDYMMGKGRGGRCLKFAVPYLKHKSNKGKRGTIAICYVHSPYGTDGNGKETISPQLLGGVAVNVSLPHNKGHCTNPLYCPQAAQYLLNFWLSRIGLWTQAKIDLINLVLDCQVFPDNNSLEGFISNEKNRNSTLAEDVKDIPSLIHKRWSDNVANGMLLSDQIDNSQHIIARRMKRNKSMSQSVGDVSMKGDTTEMLWKRTSRTNMAILNDQKEKMMRALEIGMSLGDFTYDISNMKSIWIILESHANALDMSFMKIDCFRKWMRGERKKLLRDDWVVVLKEFYSRYFD